MTPEQRQKALSDIGAYLRTAYYEGVTPDTTAEQYRAMAEAHGRMLGRVAAVLLEDATPDDIAGKIRTYEAYFAQQMVEALRDEIRPGGRLAEAARAEKEQNDET